MITRTRMNTNMDMGTRQRTHMNTDTNTTTVRRIRTGMTMCTEEWKRFLLL